MLGVVARNTDPASEEAGPYKDVTHRMCHNWILNSVGAFSGVVNHPIQGSSFWYKVIYQKEDELVHGQMTVNTFITYQWVHYNMKIYITSPLGTRKCCKHFIKVEPKLISQNTLSEMAALTLNSLIWLLKQLQSRDKLCKNTL